MVQTAWIIDDDAVYKYGFRKYVSLKHLCANIFDFNNGSEASDFLKNSVNAENLPDIIFLNIDTAGSGSWAFVETFTNMETLIGKKTALFLITPSINYNDLLRVQKHPYITDYIVKPIDAQQFEAVFTDNLLRNIA